MSGFKEKEQVSEREFSRHVAQHVVCEIARHQGFKSIRPSALGLLTNLLEA
eukprot:Pgem_evm1s12419